MLSMIDDGCLPKGCDDISDVQDSACAVYSYLTTRRKKTMTVLNADESSSVNYDRCVELSMETDSHPLEYQRLHTENQDQFEDHSFHEH